MDPYLEDPTVWMDFHESFITYCRDALLARLPERYDARIEERVSLVELPDDEIRRVRSDVGITDTGTPEKAAALPRREVTTAVLPVQPVTVPLLIYDELYESKVHILDRRNRRLVTVLELLSPSNKYSEGFEQYLTKRNSLMRTRVHLVEIDLLIEGQRLPHDGSLPRGDYYMYVSRGDRRPDCEVFSWSVRDPIPPVTVPLRAPDADLILDVQELFQTAYERGRYRRSLRYSERLGLPLKPDDLQWAAEVGQAVRQ